MMSKKDTYYCKEKDKSYKILNLKMEMVETIAQPKRERSEKLLKAKILKIPMLKEYNKCRMRD